LRAAAALLLIPAVGFAQAEPAPTPQAPAAATSPAEETVAAAPTKRKAEEEITVTGSRVRRKDLTTPAPVTVMTREQIQNSPVANVGDFLQMMPEQGNAPNTNVNNGGDGTTQISLRSLGPQRTLVLIDGKRMVGTALNGVNSSGIAPVDLNSIPTAAIERIEVLKDGASAVYGSDAIGGVVNIITRRRLNGSEATAYTGTSQHGDGTVYDFNVTSGASGDKGGFLFGAGYYDQRSFLSANRDWASRAVLYDYSTPGKEPPGGSTRIPAGRWRVNPASCTTPLCTALLKDFGAGTKNFMFDPSTPGGTQGGWRLYTPNDAYNYQAVNYLITPSQRISLFTNGDYRMNENARAYFQASFVNRRGSNLLAPEPLDTRLLGTAGIPISGSNAYNPFGIDVGDVRKRLLSVGGRSQAFDIDTFRVVGGLDGTLPDVFGPARGFFWDVSFNYGRSSGTTTTNGSLNTAVVANGIGPSFIGPNGPQCGTQANPIPNCVPVNLIGVTNPTPDQFSSLGAYTGVNSGFNQETAVQATLSGELFQLAAERPIGLAAGYEFRREYAGYQPNPIAAQGLDTDYNSLPTSGSYRVHEGFGELDIPLVSGMTGVDELEVQAAARVFNYSTFGTDATYKLGARYRPIRDVTFRATYSTAFRAPSITELYAGQAPSAEYAVDPCGITKGDKVLQAQCGAAADNGDDSNQLNSTVGGNPKLQPEKAKSITAGVVLEPQFARGLSITADFYRIQVTNTQSGGSLAPYILALCYPGSSGRAPHPEFCSLIKRDSTQTIINITDLNQNLGALTTAGIDLAVRYTLPTDFGRFGFLFDGNYLLRYQQTIADLTVNAQGTYDLGLNPRVKFNSGVNYTIEGLTVGTIGRYIGPSKECADSTGKASGSGFCWANNVDAAGQPYAPHKIAQQITFDVFASYLLRSALGNTTLSAGVRNALNTRPTRIYNSPLTYADPSAYDFVGRYFYGRISQAF
jgi:outer membrane receptor protein involved in Fe transport